MNTKQFEFDAVVNHLFAQGGPAVSQGGGCSYRNPEGKMCAVGCRIPDDIYQPAMEGKYLTDLMSQFRVPEEIAQYSGMFNDLQQMHDRFVTSRMKRWNEYINAKLPSLANFHGVKYEARTL